MDRKDVLLKATYEILKRCSRSSYVLNVLEEEVFYDDAECCGECLMEDIRLELNIPPDDLKR